MASNCRLKPQAAQILWHGHFPLTAPEHVLWDDEIKGFGVRVRPSGRKTYIVKYREGGRAGGIGAAVGDRRDPSLDADGMPEGGDPDAAMGTRRPGPG